MFMFYKAMQLVNMENECVELLRRQLWIITKIVSTLKIILAEFKKDPVYLEMQAESSSEDFGSISLDAQASALVIIGFFAQIGHDSSSECSSSCAV